MKDKSDSNTVTVTVSTSLNLLTMAVVSWWLLREMGWFSIPLRFDIALLIVLFTVVLDVKYLTLIVSAPDSTPRLLMID